MEGKPDDEEVSKSSCYDRSNKNLRYRNLAGSKNGRKIADKNFQVIFESNPSLRRRSPLQVPIPLS
jgi:hypothetical protein